MLQQHRVQIGAAIVTHGKGLGNPHPKVDCLHKGEVFVQSSAFRTKILTSEQFAKCERDCRFTCQ